MKSMKNFKVIGGIAATVVVLCIVIVAVFKFKGGTEDYRNISVFELEASATVTRDGTALDAYPGMKLMNGDNIKVGNEGYICLLLDDDKYVTLETGTEIQLNATGNSQNSKTTIELVQGAVLNELDSKLNADSSYELSTPVSVMAVRGTVFRAALTENGEASSLDLIVLDGKVATSAVLPDGSISSEENLVDAGQGAHFEKADSQSDPVYSPMDISYKDLPAQTLGMILKIYESGRISNLSIQEDELRKLYAQKTGSADDANEPEAEDSSDTADDKQEDTASDPQEISDADDADDSDDSVNTEDASDDSSQTAQSADRDSNTGSGVKPTAKPEAKPNTNTKKATKKGNKATAEPTSIPNAITPTAQPDTGSQTNPPAAAPSSQPENKVYTVTFMDSLGRTFGTQSIAAGSRAQKPKLSPAGGTRWYDSEGNEFDFNTAVTSDLTLYYR